MSSRAVRTDQTFGQLRQQSYVLDVNPTLTPTVWENARNVPHVIIELEVGRVGYQALKLGQAVNTTRVFSDTLTGTFNAQVFTLRQHAHLSSFPSFLLP